MAPLHFIDEIQQGRVLSPTEAGAETRSGRPERGAGPRLHGFVRRLQAAHEPRQLGDRGEGEQVGAHCGHAPPAAARRVAREPDVDDGETLGPVLRLDEVHPVDHRVPDLAV